MDSLKIEGFRGIKGELPISDFNVLVGPNGSGKSTILEAYATLTLLHEAPGSFPIYLVLFAARGDLRRSLISSLPNDRARIELGGKWVDLKKEINEKGALLTFKASNGCALRIDVTKEGIKHEFEGCDDNNKKGLAVLTPCIIPLETIEGVAKYTLPEIGKVKDLKISLSDVTYELVLRKNPWGEDAIFVKEVRKDREKEYCFYSAGRGLQRAFALKIYLSSPEINHLFIDELETAMHPELLDKALEWMVESRKKVTMTTQSLEVIKMSFQKLCERGRYDSNLIIIDNDGTLKVKSFLGEDACDVSEYWDDPRLMYD
ncbi:hypothetical protein IPA_02300 [Ignicoccus pacificus DSM 13166]|uniref:Endonuclease GajA/Old nuclease/RecF-like AAA domain-containing protein n=1 Tax=Ignicoccus pacificus DSM 13166 TaxID=940294 RepID=A0A977PKM4_9CREN|nr:hypothetical protein IPA_02300 [Ignicoccus pacificus DSM 13166]